MNEPNPELPRWVAARTSGTALAIAIGYSVIFVMMLSFALTGRTSGWYQYIAVVAALLALLEWASFVYLRKRGR